MLFIARIHVSKFTGSVAKDVVPVFLEAQEVSLGRDGAVVKREEHKVRVDTKKTPKEGERAK